MIEAGDHRCVLPGQGFCHAVQRVFGGQARVVGGYSIRAERPRDAAGGDLGC